MWTSFKNWIKQSLKKMDILFLGNLTFQNTKKKLFRTEIINSGTKKIPPIQSKLNHIKPLNLTLKFSL